MLENNNVFEIISNSYYSFTASEKKLADYMLSNQDGLAYLSGFGILPEFRNQGLGLIFLHFLEDSLAGEGITKLTLQVSSKNKPALSLYRKDGFDVLESLHYSPLFDEE